MDWGPALPEIRRKFSYSAKLGSPGEDDVFGPDGTELLNIKSRDPDAPEKEKLVKFKDDPQEEVSEKEEAKKLPEEKKESNDKGADQGPDTNDAKV
jgi:hypothetical protein